jgi:hypothetical protein
MKKMRILIFVAALIALLIPTAVQAGGVFYCSTLYSQGGNGSYRYPWACADENQFNQIVNQVICAQYGGGYLYQIFADHYTYYRIEWVYATQRACQITFRADYPGYPPNTGPAFPLPLILGSAALLGAILLGAGLVLRRKNQMPAA